MLEQRGTGTGTGTVTAGTAVYSYVHPGAGTCLHNCVREVSFPLFRIDLDLLNLVATAVYILNLDSRVRVVAHRHACSAQVQLYLFRSTCNPVCKACLLNLIDGQQTKFS
eukprot:SAG31_NODE_2712_length_5208_cov_1.414563_2_plen_110_part_00